jgi:membrane-associated phospholipid phosphatase
MDAVWDAEIAVNRWVQGWGGWLEPPMEVVTALGSQTLMIGLLSLVFWSVDAGLGARAYLVLMGSAMVNGVLKVGTHGARPAWYDFTVRPMSQESTFGLPSGHSQNSMAVWGYLAARLRPRWRWAWPVAGVLIALIVFSRLYLGVHFTTDVVAGLAVGALLLWAVLRYEDAALRWWRARPLGAQIGLAFAVSVVPAIATWAYTAFVRDGWTVPDSWTGSVPPDVAAESVAHVFAVGGGLFGGLAGLSVLAARGWYDAGGTVVARVSRFVIGIAGVVLLLVLTEVAPLPAAGVAGMAAEYAANLVLALWGVLAAPELFVRTGLARRAAPAGASSARVGT